MSARYREIAVFRPGRPVMESLQRFARYVWYNISPDYLFIRATCTFCGTRRDGTAPPCPGRSDPSGHRCRLAEKGVAAAAHANSGLGGGVGDSCRPDRTQSPRSGHCGEAQRA